MPLMILLIVKSILAPLHTLWMEEVRKHVSVSIFDLLFKILKISLQPFSLLDFMISISNLP